MSTTWLNPTQVARILGCTRKHAYWLLDHGGIPCVDLPTPGRRKMRRVSAAALEVWMKEHTR